MNRTSAEPRAQRLGLRQPAAAMMPAACCGISRRSAAGCVCESGSRLPQSIGFALLLLAASAHAGPRTSTDYNVPADTADAGGQRTTSSAYTNDGSLGGITGISTVASPAQTAKAGYIGQLTEVTALQLAATPTTVDETGTRQLSAAQFLDDDSLNPLAATDVTWSVMAGPLTGINSSGLATAATVYQDTAATAQGSYAGIIGTLELTVLDSIPDNFGSYAGDGLADDWQFDHFGLDNPLAGPTLDPDGDGQNNAFEFTAGLVPTDAQSRFSLSIAPVPGQPGQKDIVFDPIVAGRTYTVKTSPDLSLGSWDTLTGATESDDGDERTVTDPAGGGTKKFYQVEIVKP